MSPAADPADLSAAALAAAIREGRLTAERATAACLARIEAREGEVRAWEWLNADRALRLARARDAEAPRGPLHGVPVGIKDLIDTADMPTAYGSPIHAGHRPARDAWIVARLAEAGAIPLGKTVTTEFATFQPGKTRNPHDPGRTPGGSSSGSAAAVAAGMVPLALGSQTVGSVVRPAAFCGVAGWKPSRGALPLDGVKPLAPSFDALGGFARGLADLALWWHALTDAAIARPAERPPRIALVRTPHWEAAEPAARAALEEAADRLSRAGAEVSDTALGPGTLDGLAEAQDTIFAAEAVRALAPEWRERRDALSDKLRAVLARGEATDGEALAEARARAEAGRTAMAALLSDWDLALAPAAPGEAPTPETTGDPAFNRIWTLLLGPCLALPMGRGPAGLPLAVQLAGAPGRDDAFLADALWAERALAG